MTTTEPGKPGALRFGRAVERAQQAQQRLGGSWGVVREGAGWRVYRYPLTPEQGRAEDALVTEGLTGQRTLLFRLEGDPDA
jgi:hypothetical protein